MTREVEEIAKLVPSNVLAAALLIMGALVLAMGGLLWRAFAHRLDKIESAVSLLGSFATKESLSNMGNRFDERTGEQRERLALVERDVHATAVELGKRVEDIHDIRNKMASISIDVELVKAELEASR